MPGGLPGDATRMQPERTPQSNTFDRDEGAYGMSEGWAQARRAGPSVAFGPFRLCPRQRLLLEGDRPVRLGSRALDILMVLLERPSELVSKQELAARVWPGIVVEDGNLKVHIGTLRRTLRDGKMGNRYIATVSGRGYSFVAPVVRSEGTIAAAGADGLDHASTSLARSIAGPDLIGLLAAQLAQQRFITVVGAGDITKSIMLAAVLAAGHANGAWFVDLAPLGDPLLVPAAVAGSIGLEPGAVHPTADIARFLADKRLLLVLDNCRHVFGAAAALAAELLRSAPGVQILATGR